MLLRYFIIVMLCPFDLIAQQNDCSLDSLFNIEFKAIWLKDSVGAEGLRLKPTGYISWSSMALGTLEDNNDEIPLVGESIDCILSYFGKPNDIYNDGDTTIWMYYLRGSLLTGTAKEFIGYTLEIKFDNKEVVINYKVIKYAKPLILINGVSGTELFFSNKQIYSIDSIQVHFKGYKICSFSVAMANTYTDFSKNIIGNKLDSDIKKRLNHRSCYKAYFFDIVIENKLGAVLYLDDYIKIIPFENCQ